jgi:benzodiazapine receptor
MSEKKGITALQVGNVLAFVFVIIINSIAGGTKLLGGLNTADVSAAFPTLITPAGFTFAIWGVIYLLLGIFIVYQLLPGHRGDAFNEKIGYLFILSSLFNIAWLFLWQYEYITASVVLIFALLLSLIAIYVRLNVGRSNATRDEKICVHAPFSVYLGWITIATIADVSSALVSINWNGLGIASSTWAQLVTVVALAITLLLLVTRRDPAYGLVVVWALTGIASNQLANKVVSEVTDVTEASAAVVAVATLVLIFLVLTRSTKKPAA